jgi:hypothetical protein
MLRAFAPVTLSSKLVDPNLSHILLDLVTFCSALTWPPSMAPIATFTSMSRSTKTSRPMPNRLVETHPSNNRTTHLWRTPTSYLRPAEPRTPATASPRHPPSPRYGHLRRAHRAPPINEGAEMSGRSRCTSARTTASAATMPSSSSPIARAVPNASSALTCASPIRAPRASASTYALPQCRPRPDEARQAPRQCARAS